MRLRDDIIVNSSKWIVIQLRRKKNVQLRICPDSHFFLHVEEMLFCALNKTSFQMLHEFLHISLTFFTSNFWKQSTVLFFYWIIIIKENLKILFIGRWVSLIKAISFFHFSQLLPLWIPRNVYFFLAFKARLECKTRRKNLKGTRWNHG